MFLPIQAAAVAALTGDQDCVNDTMIAYEARRDILCDGFRSIGWEMDRPVATMFVWLRSRSSISLQKLLLWIW